MAQNKWIVSSVVTLLFCMLLLEAKAQPNQAQDTIVTLSSKDFIGKGFLKLYGKGGWYFRSGNDSTWANTTIDMTGWKALLPPNLDAGYTDAHGKLEGWFRFKFILDSSLVNIPWRLMYQPYAAGEVYIDGQCFGAYGKMGNDKEQFQFFLEKDTTRRIDLAAGQVHTLAVHIKDEIVTTSRRTSLMIGQLSNWFKSGFISIPTDHALYKSLSRKTIEFSYWTVWIGANLLFAFLFFLLFLLNKNERNLLLYASVCFILSGYMILTFLNIYAGEPVIHPQWLLYIIAAARILGFVLVLLILKTVLKIFTIRLKGFNRVLFTGAVFFSLAGLIKGLIDLYGIQNQIFLVILGGLSSFVNLAVILFWVIGSFKKTGTAQRVVASGILIFLVLVLIYGFFKPENGSYTDLNLVTAICLCFPLSLLVYVVLRFREINKNIVLNAQQIVALSEEKRVLAEEQQKQLEIQVHERTLELQNSLEYLKSTQSQLIQSEKMASLGELTAGIAHEIQNPLNFVNNFSEVNKELLAEMNEEITKGNYEEVKAIAKDVTETEQKINHHGKRADAIVKGMLQHSRSTNNAIKEPTDINALADEYLRLAYHGLRAKDKSFNATMNTDYDETIGNINIIPQDIGRVILNLITNAFYVVDEKKKSGIENYEPTVTVSTKKINGNVEVKVTDNGNGIPQKVLDKIFQPFFTTKPTGQGTGLGLSLSYDIIKAHGGELKVKTAEGDGTTFIAQLPV